MPRVAKDYVPSYRLHKCSGQAVVTLSGRDYWLGLYGSPDSRVKYHQLVAEWIAGGRKPLAVIARPSPLAVPRFSVASLVDAFVRHIKDTYVEADGTPQKSATNYIERCVRFASDAFGATPADEFTPSKAKQCRDRMVKAGWTRRGCNKGLRMIRMCWKWGVEEELVSPQTSQALKDIAPLKVNRTTAPESVPVKPVSDADMRAIQPHVAPPVWALVQLQRLTGARAGELVPLRAIDIDTSGYVWIYRPARHKTKNRGHDRIIYFGPMAQAVLQPFIGKRADPTAYLFDPREGYAERKASRSTKKKPRRPDQKPNAKKTARSIGDHYTTSSYRRAIDYGCKLAGIVSWNPHQLRHAAATQWRKSHGPDAALTLLGDKTTSMIDVYAEKDRETAMKIAAEVG